MSKRDITNLGKEIKDIIQNSVSSVDFNKINKEIGDSVNSALEEVRKALGTNHIDRPYKHPNPQQQNENKSNSQQHNEYNFNSQQQKNYQRNMKKQTKKLRVSFPANPIGRVKGTLFTVFGSIGMGIFGVAILVLSILGFLLHINQYLGIIALGLLPFFLVSIIMEARGSSLRKRLKRFRRYINLLNGRSICNIKELSAHSRLSEKFLIKDLQKMISCGMFPEGYIDENKTYLMLNRECYQQYLKEQEEKNRQLFEEHLNREQQKKSNQNNVSENTVQNEVLSALEEGKSYINQIQELNKAISDEEVSKKLLRMEEVIIKIFRYVELHPEQIKEIRKFMEYYLPTTLKLLNAYREFDNQPVQGDNISTAKKEIKNTLDTINYAFENLLDSLFEYAAWDVSTDISVLETMLAQEGLTEKELNSNRTIGG